MSHRQIARRLTAAVWIRAYPGVYRLASAPDTMMTRRFAALLYCGPHAYLSHYSAAALLGLIDRGESRHVWVTMPHGLRSTSQSGLRLRRTRVAPAQYRHDSGLMLTDPLRTLIDLAALMPMREHTGMLHRAVFQSIVSVDELRAAIVEPSWLPG